ncbi:P-loop containing nucleoside triphosphate hydrolase protein [Dipodascopsis uninucleata]
MNIVRSVIPIHNGIIKYVPKITYSDSFLLYRGLYNYWTIRTWCQKYYSSLRESQSGELVDSSQLSKTRVHKTEDRAINGNSSVNTFEDFFVKTDESSDKTPMKLTGLPSNNLRADGDHGFEVYNIKQAVVSSMRKQYAHIVSLTDVQHAVLKSLRQEHSCVVASHSGTGKSTALALHLLSTPKFRTPIASVTSVLLVPHTELGFQYFEFFSSLLRSGNAPVSSQQIIQFLYRGTDDEMMQQRQMLKKYPTPHILIATPKRLLDMLSSPKERDLINIKFVQTVVLDDADAMMKLRFDNNGYMGIVSKSKKNHKKRAHKAPIVVAMDYISSLRKAALAAYSLKLPLRVIAATSSISASGPLYDIITERGWTQGSTVDAVGVVNFQKKTYSPFSNVKVSKLLVRSNEIHEQPINRLADFPSSSETKPTSEYLTTGITRQHLETLASSIINDHSVRKGLILVPIQASRTLVCEELKMRGISSVPLRYYGGRIIVDDDSSVGNYGVLKIDTIFGTSKGIDQSTPNYIIATPNQVVGLDFPDLRKIYVVGNSTLESVQDFDTVQARLRPVHADQMEDWVKYKGDCSSQGYIKIII